MVKRLERRLDEIASKAPRDPRGEPMTGAAGGPVGRSLGVPAGRTSTTALLISSMRSVSTSGCAAAPFVVTGEGKLDEQTLQGKIVGELATRCRQGGVPCHAVVGKEDLEPFKQRILDLAASGRRPTRRSWRRRDAHWSTRADARREPRRRGRLALDEVVLRRPDDPPRGRAHLLRADVAVPGRAAGAVAARPAGPIPRDLQRDPRATSAMWRRPRWSTRSTARCGRRCSSKGTAATALAISVVVASTARPGCSRPPPGAERRVRAEGSGAASCGARRSTCCPRSC